METDNTFPVPDGPGADFDAMLVDVEMADTSLERNDASVQLFCSDNEETPRREETAITQQSSNSEAELSALVADVQKAIDTNEQSDAFSQFLDAASIQNFSEGVSEPVLLPADVQHTDSAHELNSGPSQTPRSHNEESGWHGDTGATTHPVDSGNTNASEESTQVSHPQFGHNEETGRNEDCGEGQEQSKKKAAPKSRRKGCGGITKREKMKNATIAFDSYKRGRKTKRNANATRKKGAGTKRGKQQQKNRQNVNIDSLLLSSSNTIALAKANAAKPAAPGATSKDKRKAMAEIIGQVPDLSRSTKAMDKRSVMDSITRFNNPPRADGKNGWEHSSLKTSLYHYQLVGVGFMREREKSNAAPHGGFLCDDMGFGKTIQAIANIVDGQAKPDENPKTTLIVAPSHLVNHWKNEIQKHVKDKAMGKTVTCHASNRPDDDLLQVLLDDNIVGVLITSYAEVRRSCPDMKQLADLDKEKAAETWTDRFYENCGILHRTRFRRIVLDAHEIKNHVSQTSIAVRTLSADFHWIVTGTPVHNSVEEFFPYFEFLKVPKIGTFEKFRKDYCPDGTLDRTRLNQALGTYMLRRTHGDEMFGHPLLDLPDIEVQTLTVRFSKAERYLYRQITVFCVQELFDVAKRGREFLFRSYLTFLLRLRMFTSHLLSIHPLMKRFLSPQIVQGTRAAIADDSDPEDLETCYLLERLMKNQKLPTFEELYNAHPTGKRWEPVPYSTRQRVLITRFRMKLNRDDSAECRSEALEMTTCKRCKTPPFDAYITACMHVLCHPCFAALNKGSQEIKCGCGTVFDNFQDVAFYRTIESLRDDVPMSTTEETSTEPPRLATADDIEREDINWVDEAGHLMQGAKLKAIRSCVIDWFKKKPDEKVIIFTQFLDMVHILSCLCEHENWGYVTLTGKVSPVAREKDIEEFRNDPDTRVMVASLRAGGTGINLTMATRCILVDLWWNEAIEQQAFCRMYRIGQKKGVELVRITVEDSIDDRLQSIQQRKTQAIDDAMGPDVLSPRETLANVLQICGLREDENEESGFSFVADDKEQPEN